MAPTAGLPDLPEFALKLARARARALARRNVVPGHEPEDIEQHLLLELVRRRQRFDGTRGRLAGFVARVIDNAAADLVNRHAALGRGGAWRFVSLQDRLGGDEDEAVTLEDGAAEDMALWPRPTDFEAADLRVDLGRTIGGLPAGLQELCRRLSRQPVAEIARETGTPRSSIYGSIGAIRRGFLDAGLDLYLGGSPTLSGSSR